MMRKTTTRFPGAFAAILAAGFASPGQAHEGHDHGAAPHGGTVAKTGRYQFEVVLRKDGVSVYPSAPGRGAIDVATLAGTATFTLPGAPRPFGYRLAAQPAAAGKSAEALAVTVDLSKVPATGAKVSFEVSGLPDPAERVATFTVPFALSDGGQVAFAKATKADEKAIAAQKVCPVSREELGSMGGPIKVTRGSRSVFLCCAACQKKVQADPDKYLGPAAQAAASGGDRGR